jgi:pescadillo
MGTKTDKLGRRTNNKGKKKATSKVAMTSKFGSKRKLSRHGKKLKAGVMGPSTEFMTRASVLKKLQITLKDFRRLCILKGIYPRVPPKAPKGADKVYYDIKDISYLTHEPLLEKFRGFKSFMKKVRKAAGRNQHGEARRIDSEKPQVRLDHLVKERYPRFIDALRDLDDALCMVHLFASLPSQGRITPARTALCKELVSHWEYYIIQSKAMHKTFVSVKGLYFQAVIMGEPVTWIAPHPFTQGIPRNVDFRVMVTFLDFYEVFVKFVLFKLYNLQGLQYPPVVNKEFAQSGCHLYSLKAVSLDAGLAGAQAEADRLAAVDVAVDTVAKYKAPVSRKQQKAIEKAIEEITAEEDDDMEINLDSDDEGEEAGARVQSSLNDAFTVLHGGIQRDDHMIANAIDDEANEDMLRGTFGSLSGNEAEDSRQSLFRGLRFFINREVNLEWMQLCICSLGGLVGWDGPNSPYAASSADITHHVLDRPLGNMATALPAREFVQPQWVFDCINAQIRLPIHRYGAGQVLPPHLSPFVDDAKEGYLPKYREEILNLLKGPEAQQEAQAAEEEEASGSDAEEESGSEEEQEESDEESDEEEEAPAPVDAKKQKGQKGIVAVKKVGAPCRVSVCVSVYIHASLRESARSSLPWTCLGS